MPLPILIVFGVALSALELLVIACVLLYLYYALVEWMKTHPITIPSFPSFGRTWDDSPVAPPQTVPAPAPTVPVPPIAIPIDKPIAIPKTRNRDKGIWNVYDLHFKMQAEGRYYNWGKGYEPTPRNYQAGDIYKYGITSFKTVFLRYLIIQGLFPSDKGEYILDQLKKTILAPHQWYIENVKYKVANNKEVQLIEDYVSKHGELPPGNTFRG